MKNFKLSFFYLSFITILILSCNNNNGEENFVDARFTTPIIEFGEVTFRNYSINATEYFWEFGDGNTSTEKEPTHEYQELGTFTVKLTASNGSQSDVYALLVAVGQIYPDNLIELDDLPFPDRAETFFFTHNGKGYVGGGLYLNPYEYSDDLWEFDPSNKEWNQITNDLPYEAQSPASFKIDDQVYFGLGISQNQTGLKFYRYDISNDNFEYDSEIDYNNNLGFSDFMMDAVAFTYNGFGYVIGSGYANNIPQKITWKYNPDDQSWSNIGLYECRGNAGMFHFLLGDKLIIGMGNLNTYSTFQNEKDIWEYDVTNNTWTEKNPFPGEPRRDGMSFVYNGEGYFGFGASADNATGAPLNFSDLWKYNYSEDSWTKVADLPISIKQEMFAFILGNSLYFGSGYSNSNFGNGTTKFYEYQF